MSNKIVPQVYRSIIDDVIASVQVDFDEYGMDEEVLISLQTKWESKLLETRVAEFARAPGARTESPEPNGQAGESSRASHVPSSPPPGAINPAYGISFPPPGHGLALPGVPSGSGSNGGGYGDARVKADPDDPLRLRGGAPDEDDDKPYVKPEPNAAGLLPGDEVIDSDLDDSDDELKDGDDDDGDGDVDIVFCVYEKVQRVKNKWKTVFKDGMIHINGRDYLFAKCNGEFEW